MGTSVPATPRQDCRKAAGASCAAPDLQPVARQQSRDTSSEHDEYRGLRHMATRRRGRAPAPARPPGYFWIVEHEARDASGQWCLRRIEGPWATIEEAKTGAEADNLARAQHHS